MIKDACSKFNNYSISPKIRQILLHWGYELTEKEILIEYKKEALQNKSVLFLLSIRMSEKTLKVDNNRLNKKEFHKSKQPINFGLVNVDQIVISDKFKHSDDVFKYFIGYKEVKIVRSLCIILPQMSGLS